MCTVEVAGPLGTPLGQHNGHELEQTLGVGDGQGSLACCSPWGCRVGQDLVTEQHPGPLAGGGSTTARGILRLQSLSRI